MDSVIAPESQQSNIVDQIQADLARIQDEGEITPERAYLELCVGYLGYSLEQGLITDGKDDCGIDFIEYTNAGATILQSKSVNFVGKIDRTTLAGTDQLTDLPRIRAIFSDLDNIPANMKGSLKKAIQDIKSIILRSSNKNDEPFNVTVYFCFLGKGFTKAAESEFDKIYKSPIEYADRKILITCIPVFIEDLISEKWRETNTKWANKDNMKIEEFDFPLCGIPIRDSKSAVFFTKASALVDAYKQIGYQLFEANVRCEIKNSPVNKAIRNSVLSHKGRSEFKHLNNGATIICDNFRAVGPKDSPTAFRVKRPGVINGLQSVKAIYDAVIELGEKDFAHFDDKCEILVRLHMQNAVADYKDLVKSTNNQNPMKPRNLHSNDPEQIAYERLFSEFGWFYERKEGAWSAFSSDSKRWSSLPNKKPTDFKVGKLIKKVDNEDIAQAWLAFIGFSEQAVDQKRYIFQEERLYDLAFKERTKKHGEGYGFKLNDAVSADAFREGPAPKGLLCAYLLRNFAQSVVKTRVENREEAVARLGIEKASRNDQEAALSIDNEYLKGLILRGMLLLFVEFFGYLMFNSFGENVHDKFDALLNNRSLKRAMESGDFVAVVSTYREKEYESDDVLLVIWEFYNHCIAQMIGSVWLRQWRDAPNRSKFIYGEPTRVPLISEVKSAADIFKRQMLVRVWTEKINEYKGIAEFLRATLSTK